MGLDVLLVGALARDIHFLHCHGIRPGRATMDVDFGVLMSDWDTFEKTKLVYLRNPVTHRTAINRGVCTQVQDC